MSDPKPDHTDKPNDASHNGERTLTLLKRIQEGSVEPKTIGLAERRQLVVYLMSDGYSTADTAQILQVSDRSIERDKRAIREQNALPRDPALVEQMVGRLVSEAELSIQRMRKASRDKRVSPGVKVDAEHRCFQILSELNQRLQSVGYLPTAAQKIEADLTHKVGGLPEFIDIRAEVQRLKQIASEGGGNGVAATQIGELEREVTRADMATRVAELSDQVTREEADDDGDA